MTTQLPARVSIRGGAVIVSDAAAADPMLLDNAADVLFHARHVLMDQGAGETALRFIARELVSSLSDVLELAQGAVDAGADDD